MRCRIREANTGTTIKIHVFRILEEISLAASTRGMLFRVGKMPKDDRFVHLENICLRHSVSSSYPFFDAEFLLDYAKPTSSVSFDVIFSAVELRVMFTA